jgi:type VI protein secretion system component Hcp
MAGTVELEITSAGSPIAYDPWTNGRHAGKILCTTFELVGTAGTNPKTDKPQGTRDYGAGIKVTKRLDSTSPTLLRLFAKSTGLTATFTFFSPDVGANENPNEPALKVTLGKGSDCAWLRGYTLKAPDTEVAAADSPQEPYEELHFTFTTIEYQRCGNDNQGKQVNMITIDDLSQVGGA